LWGSASASTTVWPSRRIWPKGRRSRLNPAAEKRVRFVMLPKISIITPSFNSITTIRETIESVRQQDYANWEHIVIDGGSKDGTVNLLQEYPHLVWVSEKDEGYYYAMNKGVLRAAGEIVNILNADDCFRPGALTYVARAFQT